MSVDQPEAGDRRRGGVQVEEPHEYKCPVISQMPIFVDAPVNKRVGSGLA